MNKCSVKYFVHNPQFIYKMQFWKPVDPPLTASEVRQIDHDDIMLTSASRLNICLQHAVADLPRVNNA